MFHDRRNQFPNLSYRFIFYTLPLEIQLRPVHAVENNQAAELTGTFGRFGRRKMYGEQSRLARFSE